MTNADCEAQLIFCRMFDDRHYNDQYCISLDDCDNPPYPNCNERQWHFHCICGKVMVFQNMTMQWLANETTQFSQIATYSRVEDRITVPIPYRPDLRRTD